MSNHLGRKTLAASRRTETSPTTPLLGRKSQQPNLHQPLPDLTPEQEQEIRETFQVFDSDSDKHLDFHELKTAMRAMGFDVNQTDVSGLIARYGRDRKHISYEDFKLVMTEKVRNRDPMEEIERAFRLFDVEGKQAISLDNLKRVAQELHENIDEGELEAMIDEFDLDGDGLISLEEFVSIMRDE